ncbi:MAG: transposase [Bdellovibrionales bacterium]|nr:transposase [Bdellovibrionales bacterium]
MSEELFDNGVQLITNIKSNMKKKFEENFGGFERLLSQT